MLLVSIRTNGPIAEPVRNPLQDQDLSARLLVLHFRELGVHHVLVLLAGFGLALLLARPALRAGLVLGLLLGLDLLAQLLRGLPERLRLGLDLALVVGLETAFGVLDRRLVLLCSA